MMKFPREAEPVRQYIRDNVTKPKRLPRISYGSLIWKRNKRLCCPLGLLRDAKTGCPYSLSEFETPKPFTNDQMKAFFEWFDSLTDPQYAVDTVWEK